MKKNILFLIGNEYHLYSTLCIYYKYFNSEDYCFKVIINKRPKSKRINREYSLPFEYFVFEDYLNFDDCRTVKKYPNYKKELENIFTQVDEFYTYFDFSLLLTYIVNWVKINPKAITYLVQEGVAGYYDLVFSKADLYRITKTCLAYIYIKFFRRVKGIDFVFRWGHYGKIDGYKATNPEAVKKHIRAKPSKLDLEVNVEIIKKIKRVFSFTNELAPDRRYLLYLPISSVHMRTAEKKEYLLIEQLIEIARSRNFDFIIKVKTGSDAKSYRDRYSNKALVIDAKIPVELLISDIHNSIIVSAYSSASIYYVNNNSNLWIYPLLGINSNLKPFLPHIKLVKTKSELVQCII